MAYRFEQAALVGVEEELHLVAAIGGERFLVSHNLAAELHVGHAEGQQLGFHLFLHGHGSLVARS